MDSSPKFDGTFCRHHLTDLDLMRDSLGLEINQFNGLGEQSIQGLDADGLCNSGVLRTSMAR